MIILPQGLKKRARFISAVAVTLALCGGNTLFALSGRAAPGQSPIAARYDTAIRQGQIALREFMRVSRVPGLSVAVGVRGKLAWSEGFGYSDLEQRVAVNTQTRFRLGSVSKVLTVAGVARLYQEGKLDLDAPIERYVPTFPDKGNPITTRQLAGHLGGIRHYQEKDYSKGRNIDFEHYDNVLDSLKVFQDDPLVAQPGTRYHYSTFGYTLISRVVESAAGLSFLTYMDEQVFKPLGMPSTIADRNDLVVANRTRFYERNSGGQIINAAYVDSSYKWASGGFLSTAEDLVAFGFNHLSPGFFKRETLDLMFASQRTADGKETGVGIGWRIATDSSKRKVIHHAGSINGGRSVIIIYPDAGVVISLLSNLGQTPPAVERTAQTLAEPFLEIVEGRERKSPPPSLAATYDYVADDYVAESANQPGGGRIEIVRAKGSYTGWMTTPRPLSEFARRTGLPALEQLKIVSVTASGDETSLLVVSPAGLFPLRLHFAGNVLAGEISCPLGPKPLDMKIHLSKTGAQSTSPAQRSQ